MACFRALNWPASSCTRVCWYSVFSAIRAICWSRCTVVAVLARRRRRSARSIRVPAIAPGPGSGDSSPGCPRPGSALEIVVEDEIAGAIARRLGIGDVLREHGVSGRGVAQPAAQLLDGAVEDAPSRHELRRRQLYSRSRLRMVRTEMPSALRCGCGCR